MVGKQDTLSALKLEATLHLVHMSTNSHGYHAHCCILNKTLQGQPPTNQE